MMNDYRTLLRGCFVALTACSLLLTGCGDDNGGGPGPVEATALADLDGAGIQALCNESTARLDTINTPTETCTVLGVVVGLVTAAAPVPEGGEAPTTEEIVALCQDAVTDCETEAPASFTEADIPCNLQAETGLDGCTATNVEYSACTETGGDALEAAWSDVKGETCDGLNDMESLAAKLGPYVEPDNTPECQVLADKCPGLFGTTVTGPPPEETPAPDEA